MTEEALFGIVEEIVREVTGVACLTMDTEFVNDLAFNSMDVANLISAFEEKFDVDIPMKDVRNLMQVRDVIQYMKKMETLN
ncbi:acyl carrier protein [Faecalicatena sp. AGMB00832]|uniref:Acyl carrier protein n=1 Tax=Faecalicatena faecalis TaxID=2726362 RepID=A0ABS6D296_9FIRM|nr:phosphopantetheine-binding protein [Faecalicatena faecalis]MBU3875720.1 acyl carrier protein [Faecalicatena faecalis]